MSQHVAVEIEQEENRKKRSFGLVPWKKTKIRCPEAVSAASVLRDLIF